MLDFSHRNGAYEPNPVHRVRQVHQTALTDFFHGNKECLSWLCCHYITLSHYIWYYMSCIVPYVPPIFPKDFLSKKLAKCPLSWAQAAQPEWSWRAAPEKIRQSCPSQQFYEGFHGGYPSWMVFLWGKIPSGTGWSGWTGYNWMMVAMGRPIKKRKAP